MADSHQGASPTISRRYFYTDPQAVGWMQKNFGMKFYRKYPPAFYEDGLLVGTDEEMEDIDRHEHIYFIHPESLHLLEPQMGDLVKVMGNVGYLPAGEGFAEKYALRMARANCQPHATGRIIQRNGIAFHWPESEAVPPSERDETTC